MTGRARRWTITLDGNESPIGVTRLPPLQLTAKELARGHRNVEVIEASRADRLAEALRWIEGSIGKPYELRARQMREKARAALADFEESQ